MAITWENSPHCTTNPNQGFAKKKTGDDASQRSGFRKWVRIICSRWVYLKAPPCTANLTRTQIWSKIWRFPKSWRYPRYPQSSHPVVMDDHDFVLKLMVTTSDHGREVLWTGWTMWWGPRNLHQFFEVTLPKIKLEHRTEQGPYPVSH